MTMPLACGSAASTMAGPVQKRAAEVGSTPSSHFGGDHGQGRKAGRLHSWPAASTMAGPVRKRAEERSGSYLDALLKDDGIERMLAAEESVEETIRKAYLLGAQSQTKRIIEDPTLLDSSIDDELKLGHAKFKPYQPDAALKLRQNDRDSREVLQLPKPKDVPFCIAPEEWVQLENERRILI